MPMNESFTYDDRYRVTFDPAADLYVDEVAANPLGVTRELARALSGEVTEPRVLECKLSVERLIEDFEGFDKNIKDIDLCVAWSTGELYMERFGITSLPFPENADGRQYHGVTHTMDDIESGAKHLDLAILSELIEHLNDPVGSAVKQRQKYE